MAGSPVHSSSSGSGAGLYWPAQTGAALSEQAEVFRPNCLSIDLEVSKKDCRIHAFDAVRGDTGRKLELPRW